MDGKKLKGKNSNRCAIWGFKNYYAKQFSNVLSFFYHFNYYAWDILVYNEAIVLSFASIKVISMLT